MARQLLSEKDKHIGTAFNHARDRAKRLNLPFSITLKYLRAIAEDKCPVFHTPFEWGKSGLGCGKFKENGPQLDRIEPELGYVEGNVAFISHRANRLKDNGTMQDHYDIADWIWSHLHAKPNSTPPVPKRTNLKGVVHSEHRSVLATWTGKDHDNPHHHSGPIQGQDIDHSSEEGGGDSVGQRGQEMVTLTTLTYLENYGDTEPEIIRLEFGSGRLLG